MLNLPILVATLAPTINCIQLFPQLYKTYITKSVKDLSPYSLLLILMTNLLWLLHGYFIFDLSLMIAAIISMNINILLLTLYLICNKKNKKKQYNINIIWKKIFKLFKI